MEKSVNLAILKIKEIEFSISPKEAPENIPLGINFRANVIIEKEKDSFELQVIFNLVHPETNEVYVHINVSNKFKIENIMQFATGDGGTINIPDGALITMLSLSISHTRALLAKNTSGTNFEKFYVPIVNPTEIASQIFKRVQ